MVSDAERDQRQAAREAERKSEIKVLIVIGLACAAAFWFGGWLLVLDVLGGCILIGIPVVIIRQLWRQRGRKEGSDE